MDTQSKRNNTHKYINIALVIAALGYSITKLNDPVKHTMAIIVLCTCTVILLIYAYGFKTERDKNRKK